MGRNGTGGEASRLSQRAPVEYTPVESKPDLQSDDVTLVESQPVAIVTAPSHRRLPTLLTVGFVVAFTCALWLIWYGYELEDRQAVHGLHGYMRSAIEGVTVRLQSNAEYLRNLGGSAHDSGTIFSLPVVLLGVISVLFVLGMSFMLMRQGKDLAERRQVEQELVDARRSAEAASVQKGQFLANMSHEIRTPMTAILGYLDLISDSCPRRCEFAGTELRGYIDAVQRNGRHLMELINSVLDLSKIEAGKLEILREPCTLAEIVSDVLTLTHPVAESKGLSVSAEHFTKLPETIVTDAFRLRQILVNLISNAIKFTEKGSIRIKVGFQKRKKESGQDVLTLRVEDTGVGIPAESLPSLFSPFSQAESSTDRKYGGTGLGLTISRMLARLLGGDLTVKSVEGEGSTFTLTIATEVPSGTPMQNQLVSSTNQERTKKPLSTRIPTLDSRILLAEDGIDNQRLISTLLHKTGAKVTIADNGQKAVDEAMSASRGDAPYDLILMDMQMPVLDGYGATQKLRHLGYNRPIIALTANALSGDRQKCLEAGCDDYLRKPIESERLFAAILRLSQRDSVLELTREGVKGYNAVS